MLNGETCSLAQWHCNGGLIMLQKPYTSLFLGKITSSQHVGCRMHDHTVVDHRICGFPGCILSTFHVIPLLNILKPKDESPEGWRPISLGIRIILFFFSMAAGDMDLGGYVGSHQRMSVKSPSILPGCHCFRGYIAQLEQRRSDKRLHVIYKDTITSTLRPTRR